jgi:dihydrolipoamide dehydrogenase
VILGLEGTAEDLAHVIHPHPTLGEGMMEAAHGLVGGAIHM